MFGNVKFIAELGKLDMLNEAILHKCIKILLDKQKTEKYCEMCENLECLCKMMPSIGFKLDKGESVKLMDQYFERIKILQTKKEIQTRIRFLLKDLIELRENNWKPRQTQLDNAPKTMKELRNGSSFEDTSLNNSESIYMQQQHMYSPFGQQMYSMNGNNLSSHQNPIQPYMFNYPYLPRGTNTYGIPPYQQQHQQFNNKFLFNGGDPSYGSNPYFNYNKQLPSSSSSSSNMNNYPNFQNNFNNPLNKISSNSSVYTDKQLYHQIPSSNASSIAFNSNQSATAIANNNNNNLNSQREKLNSSSSSSSSLSFNNNNSQQQQAHMEQNNRMQNNALNNSIIPPRYQQKHLNGKTNHTNNSSDSDSLNVSFESQTNGVKHPYNDLLTNSNENFDLLTLNSKGQSLGSNELRKSPLGNENIDVNGIQLSLPYQNGNGHHMKPNFSFNNNSSSPPLNTQQMMHSQTSFVRPQYMYPPNLMNHNRMPIPPPLPPFLNFNSKQALTDREEMDIKPAVECLNKKNSKKTLSQTQPISSSSPPPSPPFIQQQPLTFQQQQTLAAAQSNLNLVNKNFIQLKTTQSLNTQLSSSLPYNNINNNNSVAQTLILSNNLNNNLVLTPTTEILPLNKPIIPLEKILQVDTKKHNKLKAQINTSKQELNKKVDLLLKDYLEKDDSAVNAVKILKNLKFNHDQLSEMIRFMVVQTLIKEDTDRLNVSKLFIEFHNASLLPTDVFMNGFNQILENLSDLEIEYHFVKSHISLYAARAVCDGVITLHDLAQKMKHGTYYPLFFLCMQNMHKIKSPEWLRQQLEKSKINLIDMLSNGDRTKERLIQILEDRELGFLYPMLKIESALLEKIQNNVESSELKIWINENVNEELANSINFIQSLVTCIVKNAAEKTLLTEGKDSNSKHDKSSINAQKKLIEQYKLLLQEYLNSNTCKQVEAIYAMQIYAETKGQLKNFLSILFHQMYDLEIIEEEAFYQWKDEVNDNYPNKGQVLFHLQKWFNWLQEASEESSNSDS